MYHFFREGESLLIIIIMNITNLLLLSYRTKQNTLTTIFFSHNFNFKILKIVQMFSYNFFFKFIFSTPTIYSEFTRSQSNHNWINSFTMKSFLFPLCCCCCCCTTRAVKEEKFVLETNTTWGGKCYSIYTQLSSLSLSLSDSFSPLSSKTFSLNEKKKISSKCWMNAMLTKKVINAMPILNIKIVWVSPFAYVYVLLYVPLTYWYRTIS